MTANLFALITAAAENSPDSPAILAPGHPQLTYKHLRQQLTDDIVRLRQHGVQPGDRVAILLPNGPELALAFLTVANAAIAAPLNPSLALPELERYLAELKPQHLILGLENSQAVDEIAKHLGIPVIGLKPDLNAPAGCYILHGEQTFTPFNLAPPNPENVGLMLFTSGTTDRPKLVPFTHANMIAQANTVVKVAQLTPTDRVLNVMPLVHVMGLLGILVPTLASGGSVVCLPGMDPAHFFDWLVDFRPTWFSAAPGILQVILARVPDHRPQIDRHCLRYFRCASAPLPVTIQEQLEQAFKVPVITAYGMTEACGTISVNPLPPAVRKPGSVGQPAGSEVAIMDENGSQLLPSGVVGEIVIRGANVTSGYANALEENARCFVNGWLRTGDQGHFDRDGFLWITGRIKEIILRGGENISPYEVEDALYRHPAVASAAVFAIPDAAMGEVVAAAVLVKTGASLTEKEILTFAAEHLSPAKIPVGIMILDEFPRTTTGKVLRARLAAQFLERRPVSMVPLVAGPEMDARRQQFTEILTRLWGGVLGLPEPDAHAHFLDLGGDSLLSVRLLSQIEDTFQCKLGPGAFFQAPTIQAQVDLLLEAGANPPSDRLILLKPGDPKLPALFWVGYAVSMHTVSKYLKTSHAVYGIQFTTHDEMPDFRRSFPEIAADFIKSICQFQPKGPYFLAGSSLAGCVAHEMACQLVKNKQKVAFLGMIDTYAISLPSFWQALPRINKWQYHWWTVKAGIELQIERLNKLDWKGKIKYLRERAIKRLGQLIRAIGNKPIILQNSTNPVNPEEPSIYAKMVRHSRAYQEYTPQIYPGTISFFRVPQFYPAQEDKYTLGWWAFTKKHMDVYFVPGDHTTMLEEPNVQIMAQKIDEAINKCTLS